MLEFAPTRLDDPKPYKSEEANVELNAWLTCTVLCIELYADFEACWYPVNVKD